MRRRVVSVAVGLAAGTAACLVASRFVSTWFGPLVVGAGAAALVAIAVSELWLANARASRVIAEAIGPARRPGGEGGTPPGQIVTTSPDATVVYNRDQLRMQIRRPKGRHRRTSKAGVR